MVLTNIRNISNGDSTLGTLLKDGVPVGFVIEDEYRKKKIKGETRIPKGVYTLRLRKSETPLTVKYRNRFAWFKWHIELENVTGFTGIYIHIGNYESNTAGCQCIGKTAGIKNGNFMVQNSTVLYKELYIELLDRLEKGEKITYEIIDNDLNHITK